MNRIKNMMIPFVCNLLLTPRNSFDDQFNQRKIKCARSDVSIMTNTSNNIMKIRIGKELFFFRECKLHLEIHQYVSEEIQNYYTKLHSELIEDRMYIESVLAKDRNFKKFVNMGITNDCTSGAYNFCMGNGGGHIGLYGMSSEMEERVKEFVQYIWGDLFVYKLNNGLKKGEYQTYNAIRSIATYRLAKLFGVQELIPETEYAWIYIDDQLPIFGTIMKEAPGVCMEKMDTEMRKSVCTPELQRALNNLNCLDVICLEKDHRPGNYNVILDKGKAKGIVAFDNDSPNSFGIGKISFETYGGCSPWIVSGNLNRPYMDRELANRILDVSERELYDTVGFLLNKYQYMSLKHRLNRVKKILSGLRNERFLDKDQWNETTIAQELCGKYGTTYLMKFLQKQDVLYQPWIREC